VVHFENDQPHRFARLIGYDGGMGWIIPRFSLRSLFILTAVYAAVLASRQPALDWSSQRQKALFWFGTSRHGSYAWNHRRQLPLSLLVWSDERYALDFITFARNRMSKDEVHWIDDFRRLFPEARVVLEDSDPPISD
jgi:hypothetical protein